MAKQTQSDNTIQIDPQLQRRIEEVAKAQGISSENLVREAVEDFAARRNGGRAMGDSAFLWDAADRISESVPPEEWAKVPADLAKQFDHYHYGHPRED